MLVMMTKHNEKYNDLVQYNLIEVMSEGAVTATEPQNHRTHRRDRWNRCGEEGHQAYKYCALRD
jgi:hypothetical protein